MRDSGGSSQQLALRAQVICPHCWHRFAPEEILWISSHPELLGDPVAGQDAQRRFLPASFDAKGLALDARGVACSRLACPRCHLSVPRGLLEMKPLFVSILGAPSSGKSYFLTAMSWALRSTLLARFRLSFLDADATANQTLTNYEDILFQNPREDQLVVLPKTEPEGELYEAVTIEGREVWYPRPFVFSLQPVQSHPGYDKRARYSRLLCLYDNAGENFLPGQESARSPGTQHLALSEALLFVFDPTQHIQFRKACEPVTEDPQVRLHDWTHRQDLVLQEAANRIRNYSGLGQHEKYSKPLIVVVNKFDVWRELTRIHRVDLAQVLRPVKQGLAALDLEFLTKVSRETRSVLLKFARDIVAAAEGFASDVFYIPVSPIGRSPELDEQSGSLPIRPRDVRPIWAEIPMLYALSRVAKGLVLAGRSAQTSGDVPDDAHDKGNLPSSPDAGLPSHDAGGKPESPKPRLWKETGS